MIRSFRHAGLEKFFRTGNKAGIQPAHARKLAIQLGTLNLARNADAMDVSGWDLHPLKGDRPDESLVGQGQRKLANDFHV